MSTGGVRVELDGGTDDPSAWDAYLMSNAQATVYHGRGWRDVMREAFGYRSWLMLARDQASGKPRGALPLYLVRSPLGSRLVAVPFRDRGGPLYEDAATLEALLAAARQLAERERAGSVLVKTLAPLPGGSIASLGYTEHSHWVHSVVDLKAILAEELWKKIGDKTRNMVRQAQKRGLAFADLSADADAGAAWYELHLDTQQRLGVPPFPVSFFRTLLKAMVPAGSARLFAVRDGERAVAATIVFLEPQRAIYAYSASSEAGRASRANDLMLHEVLQFAIGAGKRWMDLGSDSPSQDSLLFFKRRWLAQQHPIPSYAWGAHQLSALDSSSARYRLARSAVSALPRFLFRRLSFAVRIFG